MHETHELEGQRPTENDYNRVVAAREFTMGQLAEFEANRDQHWSRLWASAQRVARAKTQYAHALEELDEDFAHFELNEKEGSFKVRGLGPVTLETFSMADFKTLAWKLIDLEDALPVCVRKLIE